MKDARPSSSLHRIHITLGKHSVMVRAHFGETVHTLLQDQKDDGAKCHDLAEAVTRAIDNDLTALEALKTAEHYSARERKAVKNLLSAFGLS